MGAKLGGEDEDAIVDINITPFVDIILVVLIIFMVTATYINEKSIKVDLPDAATGDGTESTSLAITLDAQSTLYLNGEKITESALRTAIQSAKAELSEDGKPKDVVCLIGADHSISHGEVVHIIDLVKQEGIAKFAINIEPKPVENNP